MTKREREGERVRESEKEGERVACTCNIECTTISMTLQAESAGVL